MTLTLQPMPPSEYVLTLARMPKRLTRNALSEGVGLKVQQVVITASTDLGSTPCSACRAWGLKGHGLGGAAGGDDRVNRLGVGALRRMQRRRASLKPSI